MRLIRTTLACVGALTLICVVVIVLARRPLLEWALQSAVSDSGLLIEPIHISAVGTTGIEAGPVKLKWQGQALQVDSLNLPFTSVFPPKLGVIQLKGATITLQPELLATLPKTAPAQEAPPSPRTTADLLAALEGVNAEIKVRIGSEPKATFDTALRVRSTESGLGGALTATGNGVNASAILAWDMTTARISAAPLKANIEIGELLEMVRAWIPGELGAFTAQGTVDLDLEAAGGDQPLAIKGSSILRGGSFELADMNLRSSGIDAQIRWRSLTDAVTEDAQGVSIAKIEVGNIVFRNTEIAVTLLGPDRFRLQSLKTEGFGGIIRFSSAEGTIDPLDVTLDLSVESLDLAEVAKILPPTAATPTGRVDGRIQFARRANRWFLLGGSLSLRQDSEATLRVNMPGLITGGMDPKAYTYDVLRKVENGLLNLRMESLEAKFSPVTQDTDVAALITITGRPLSDELKAPVSFDVTVRGDVTHLISFGLRDDISFSTKP